MRRTIFLALAIVAIAIAYVLGTSRGGPDLHMPDEDAAIESPGVPHAAEPAQPARPQGVGQATESVDRSPQQKAFWGLVDDTRSDAGDDTGRQSSLLEQRLRELSPERIVAFERVRRSLDERAYTWDLWGAAYVIEDGCSDDCFRDFRAYLISLGDDVYQAALRDPDSLADVVEDAEEGDWENADDVAPDAYEAVADKDIPVDDDDLDGDPRGQPWDDEDIEQLEARYPALTERFR